MFDFPSAAGGPDQQRSGIGLRQQCSGKIKHKQEREQVMDGACCGSEMATAGHLAYLDEHTIMIAVTFSRHIIIIRISISALGPGWAGLGWAVARAGRAAAAAAGRSVWW